MSKNKKLLIVSGDQKSTDSLLSLATDYDVEVTADVKTAVDVVKTKIFHVVVVDLSLPSSEALALMEQVKSFRNETIILVLTEKSGLTKILLSRAHGALDYIVKPCSEEQAQSVLQRVSQTIKHWDVVIESSQQEKQTA